MADFVKYYDLPAILVVQNYLGSINHTLLSIEVLKARGIRLLGIVINGVANDASEAFIEQYSQIGVLARVPHFDKIDSDSVNKYSQLLRTSLNNLPEHKTENKNHLYR